QVPPEPTVTCGMPWACRQRCGRECENNGSCLPLQEAPQRTPAIPIQRQTERNGDDQRESVGVERDRNGNGDRRDNPGGAEFPPPVLLRKLADPVPFRPHTSLTLEPVLSTAKRPAHQPPDGVRPDEYSQKQHDHGEYPIQQVRMALGPVVVGRPQPEHDTPRTKQQRKVPPNLTQRFRI